jgi:hypothetical protein
MLSSAALPSVFRRSWGLCLIGTIVLAGGCRGTANPSRNTQFSTDVIIARADPEASGEAESPLPETQLRSGECRSASRPAPIRAARALRKDIARPAVSRSQTFARKRVEPGGIQVVRFDGPPGARAETDYLPGIKPIFHRPRPLRLIAFEESADDVPVSDRYSPLGRFLKQKGWYPATFESSKRTARFRVRKAGTFDDWDDVGDSDLEPTRLDETEEDSDGLFDDEETGPEADPIFGDGDESFVDTDELSEDPFTLREDFLELCPTLFCDAVSCFTWTNALILGVSAGGAIAIREHLDGDVRAYTAEHPLRWSEGSQVLRQFGEFSYQVPALFAVYGWSLWSQDEHMHEFSKAVISAYAISAVTTVAIKGMTDTHRPTDQFQDGKYGFPSYHTASTFAIAAVADEYYGWPVGLPCYVLAGLVGWSRIDQREHDLSDVVFGSILGFVIGKSVAAAHMDGITGCQITPYYDPATRALGATFHKRF